MQFPEGLYYTESHEWVKEEGCDVTIGLTDYAQSQLKDIVFVELPEVGSRFKKGEGLGVVESVKTVADIFSPVTGQVIQTNADLKNLPQYVNEDPYGKGWMIRMEVKDKEELAGLLSAKSYQSSLTEGH